MTLQSSANLTRSRSAFGVHTLAKCRLASTESLVPEGLQCVDGAETRPGDFILLTDQEDLQQNGIWEVSDKDWTQLSVVLPHDDRTLITRVDEGAANSGSWLLAVDGDVVAARTIPPFTAVVQGVAYLGSYTDSDHVVEALDNAEVHAGIYWNAARASFHSHGRVNTPLIPAAMPPINTSPSRLRSETSPKSSQPKTTEHQAINSIVETQSATVTLAASDIYLVPSDYGLTGVASQNATTGLQNMIADAQSTGRPILLPNGIYRTTAPLTISQGLTLEGVGNIPYQGRPLSTRGNGAWLHFDHLGKGIVFQGPTGTGSASSGITLRNLGTFRSQPSVVPGSTWSPGGFDYDLEIGSADVLLDNLMLLNPTRGIRKRGDYGRLQINNLRGQPFRNGIVFEEEYDLPVIIGVRWWPFWEDRTEVHNFTIQNRIGMLFYRCDGVQLTNYFGINEFASLVFSQNSAGHGTVLRGTIENVYSDLSRHGVIVESNVTNGVSLQFSNFVHYGLGRGTGSIGMRIRGSNSQIDVCNADLSGEAGSGVTLEGTGTAVQISNLRSREGWNLDTVNAPLVLCGAGNTVRITQEATALNGGGAPHVGGNGTVRYNMVRSGGVQLSPGQTTIAVAHGLAGTPRVDQIQITPRNSFGQNASYFLISANSTNLQIGVAGADAGSSPAFVWRASLE